MTDYISEILDKLKLLKIREKELCDELSLLTSVNKVLYQPENKKKNQRKIKVHVNVEIKFPY